MIGVKPTQLRNESSWLNRDICARTEQESADEKARVLENLVKCVGLTPCNFG